MIKKTTLYIPAELEIRVQKIILDTKIRDGLNIKANDFYIKAIEHLVEFEEKCIENRID